VPQLVAGLGEAAIGAIVQLGEVVHLAWLAVRRGLRPPFALHDITYQIFQHGIRSLPLTTFMSLFIGMILAWQFGWALQDFGAKMALGNTSSLALVRELVPSVLAVTVGAKMAAGMAAELGSMKVTEQIDAIAALGADPIKKLVWPRLAASTLGLPLLVAWGNLMALIGGMLIADSVFGVPAGYFYETYVEELAPLDYVSSLVKAWVFGGLVGLIGCHHGFSTQLGTEAVGQSTTNTVVATSISIIIADFFLTMVFLPV
jgi:phospholipid/cholesterol/gamma-HCH transport system permease protein